MRIFDRNHTTAILKDIKSFVSKHPDRRIVFCDCPSEEKRRPLHLRVDTESKQQVPSTYAIPCKTSWEFCRKEECDPLIRQWQMYSQATNWKGATIPWSHRQWRGSHRPILCQGRRLAQILRTLSITVCQSHSYDHEEYRQRFFPNEPKTCSCDNTTVEMREHIIYNCPLYDKSWRLIDTSLQSLS